MTLDTKEELLYVIKSGLSQWFPNLIVNSLQVSPSPDTNTVSVYLVYSIAQTNIADELVINFEQ